MVFELGPSYSIGIVDLPKAQILMYKIFDSGPHFGLMAQNGPKLENGTTPTVFELGPSNFQGLSTYPRQKKLMYKIFHFGLLNIF